MSDDFDWLEKVRKILEGNTYSTVVRTYPINFGRHHVLETSDALKYQVMFKSDFFNSFGRIFNKDGVGESVNVEWVDYALSEGIHNFLFVHGDAIYVCPVLEFHDYAIANKTIRVTDSGETTMSVPVRMLRRLE